jgi:acyl carrier protein
MYFQKASEAVHAVLRKCELQTQKGTHPDDQSHFSDDLQIDDLEELELIMFLEKELDIEIPDEDVADLRNQTVDWLIKYLMINHHH